MGAHSVGWSVSAIWALGASILSGQFFLVARMFTRTGHAAVVAHTLASSKSDLLKIAVVDCLGAGLLVAGVVGFGLTRPVSLLTLLDKHPSTAWAFLGLTGPLIGSALLDRVPVKALVDALGHGKRGVVSVGDLIDRIRSRSVDSVMDMLYTEQSLLEDELEDRLRREVRNLTSQGWLHFDDIAHQVLKYAKFRGRTVPAQAKTLLSQRGTVARAHVAVSSALVLADTLITLGWHIPLSTACKAAQRRQAPSSVPPPS